MIQKLRPRVTKFELWLVMKLIVGFPQPCVYINDCGRHGLNRYQIRVLFSPK
jgi:hypothetical protein